MMATLTIPDSLYEQLRAAATRQHRPVEDLLREAIETVASADDSLDTQPMTRDEEMHRLRDALGEKLVAFDARSFLTKLGIQPMANDDLDRAMDALPEFEPSLSETIIRMRTEDSRLHA